MLHFQNVAGWLEGIRNESGNQKLPTKLKEFFRAFSIARIENNSKENEEERDWYLTEYGRLAMQGTNDLTSMEWRDEILRRYYLR
ncbi:MAG: hypothetical protein VW547_06940 [Alphaproteobacteria bacterium]